MEITLELFGIIIGCSLGVVLLLDFILVIIATINIANTGVRSLNKAWWIIICIFVQPFLGCLLFYCLGSNAKSSKKKNIEQKAEIVA